MLSSANPKAQEQNSFIKEDRSHQSQQVHVSTAQKLPPEQIQHSEPQTLLQKVFTKSTTPQEQFEELIALYHQGSYQEVLQRGEVLSPVLSHSFPLYNILGAAYAKVSKLENAVRSYQNAIRIRPDFTPAYNNLGNILSDLKRFDEALASYKQAIEIKPDYADAHNNLGGTLYELNRYEDAIASYKKALAFKPDFTIAQNNLGNILKDLKRYDEAIFSYRKVLDLKPDHADAVKNLGWCLYNLNRYEEALIAFKKALEIKPEYDEVYYNLGNALYNLQRYEEALQAYHKALQLRPNYAQAQNNLGVALCFLRREEEAIPHLKRAIELKPNNAEAHNNLGNIYCVLKRYGEAVLPFTKALEIKPDYTEAKAHRLHLLAHICDWPSLDAVSEDISSVGLSGASCSPFSLLSLEDSPLRHRQRSELYAKDKFSHREPLPPFSRPALKASTLKIGYFSGDFHNHATMHLMAGLFEKHNKKRFRLYAYSYGPAKNDEMRQRLKKTVDVFHDVGSLTDKQIAELARKEGLDIAIDLKGYTQDARVGIFSYRAAPIQITYLGYPGTTGSSFMDYIIADNSVIPTKAQQYYSEKVIYLPHSYQVNDDIRSISEKPVTRRQMGLPDEGFVFCCFNNNYKISSEEYDIWMRLLSKVENSVLWLFQANRWAEQNLRREAEKKGVDPRRIIFAEKKSFADHLARHRLADLFLDTFNYNAHTTASDALWAGLPVLTKVGQGFAARVGASLLTALKMSELITTTKEEYEEKALELALHPSKLAALKDKLETQRTTTPLFDTKLFTKHIEKAYELAYERWHDGKEPSEIVVPAVEELAQNQHQHNSQHPQRPDLSQQNKNELVTLYTQGDFEEVIEKAEELSQNISQSYFLFNLLGTAYARLGRYDKAIRFFNAALKISPHSADAHNNLGNVQAQYKLYDSAITSYKKAVMLNPRFMDGYNNLGTICADLKRYEEAIDSFKKVLEIKPDNIQVHTNLGNVLYNLKCYEEALPHFAFAVEKNRENAEAHYNLGNTFKALKRYKEAETVYTKAIQLKPDYPEVYNNLGATLKGMKRHSEAVLAYYHALKIKPDYAEAYNNLGVVLSELHRFDEAIAAYKNALNIKPDYAKAYNNLGTAFQDLKRTDEALSAYRKAIELSPHFSEAYVNIGNAFHHLRKYEEALSAYTRALQLNGDNAETLNNNGKTLKLLNRYNEAISSYTKALVIDPSLAEAKAQKYHLLSHLCEWEPLKNIATDLSSLGTSEVYCAPFALLSLEDSPERHRKRSQLYVKEKFPINELAPISRPTIKPSRLKVGYFSSTFHNHPVMHLMVKVFEQHNKSKFSLYGYSFGPTIKDEMQQRFQRATAVFKDVSSLSDKTIAEIARQDGIDIAVDLTGYTTDARTEIFAYRAAPVQINYLGYPGTMGAPFMDYIIGDKVLIPTELRKYYSEKIIYLPHSFMASDNGREISEKLFTRQEMGLPEKGFVFCCFNNSYKITSKEFDIWMRLLAKVEGSVFWLTQPQTTAAYNLRKEAAARGINPKRLVFAQRLPVMADHLARHKLADLFLDTFNYNAHTTASDALWAGLPVLTKVGQGFASRVGASLLTAIGMPELITTSEEQYETIALGLALNPKKLAALRDKLAQNRTTTPLFDTTRFTQNLEKAYELAYERWFEGKQTVEIEVPSLVPKN